MAYSLDLRKKVVEAYRSGKWSQATLAKTFHIGLMTVKRYLKLERERRDLFSPGVRGRPGKVTAEGYRLIMLMVKRKPTITLRELAEIYDKRKKIKLSPSMVYRACKKLNLKRKDGTLWVTEEQLASIKSNKRHKEKPKEQRA